MRLTSAQIERNYHQALQLAEELIESLFRLRGHQPDALAELQHELSCSALAEEEIVRLIQTTPFNPQVYRSSLLEALQRVKKLFFLEVNKKRFVSLSVWTPAVESEWLPEEVELEDSPEPISGAELLEWLRQHLPPERFQYLNDVFLAHRENRRFFREFVVPRAEMLRKSEFLNRFNTKLQQFQRLFPDGRIPWQVPQHVDRPLKEQEIVAIYQRVLAGIDSHFPAGFWSHQARYRAAVVVRYLVRDYLHQSPRDLLREAGSTFFIRYRIQAIYRLFNYSVNRVLGNAFPLQVQPWMHSRIPPGYWDRREHRVLAIRWLVEEVLGLTPGQPGKNRISKKTFARHGLSYMFTRYYNSVTAALLEAYPHLQPWEVGKVSPDYWTPQTAAAAVRRMVEKLGWSPEELPEKYRMGQLTRQTFNRMGLATVFEKMYGKSIYRALAAAFPGRFEPWEFGNVPAEFWKNPANLFRASRWVAQREGVPEQDIPAAIRQKRLTFRHFMKYSIGERLKRLSHRSLYNLFFPFFQREQQRVREELRIEQKLKQSIRRESMPHPLLSLLMYGFFLPMVKQYHQAYRYRYRRIQRRRARYLLQ